MVDRAGRSDPRRDDGSQVDVHLDRGLKVLGTKADRERSR
jgi:hypothetical protein